MFKYTVMKLIPNQIANECINIGVIIVDERGRVYTQFLDKFDRVRTFAKNDLLTDKILPILIENIKQGDLANLNARIVESEKVYACHRFEPFRMSLGVDPETELASLSDLFLTNS
jgi:hypothetical protein